MITTRIGLRRETDTTVVPREPASPDVHRLRRHFPVAMATWAVGAGLFLCLAAVIATAALSWPDENVPRSLVADQQARTELAAGQVQRALDGGISDLSAVAAGITALADVDTPHRLLSRLVHTRTRYRGVAYLAPTGEVRARAGAGIDTTAGATAAGNAVLVRAPHVYVAVPVDGAGVLVAELTSDTLTTPLSLAGPGSTHLFDHRGRGIDGTANASTVTLPAARPGHALRDVDGRPTVVTWAPVSSQAGLTVVTDHPEPARATEKHELLLLGVLIATLTVVIFGWLHVLVIGPLSALVQAADRLACGDTRDPVIVRRYDRLGLVARDLERIRRHLPRGN